MRKSLAVAAAAAAITTPAALASGAFSGNPCALVSAKQVAAFGIPASCKPTTLRGPGFTVNSATWNLTSPTQHLSVGVHTYATSSGAGWNAAMQTLRILPSGQGKKVSGIGSLAYEAAGGGTTAINFVVGKQIVNVTLRTTKPLSLQAFNVFAKSVAAKL